MPLFPDSVPYLECLENRIVPASGRGKALLTVPPPSGSPALQAPLDSGKHPSGKSASVGFKIDDNPPTPLPPGAIPLQELFSGYPLPPNMGPRINGTLVATNPSALPMPQGTSTVRLVPILVSMNGGNPGSTGTVTYQDPASGATYSVPVLVVAAGPTAGLKK